MTAERVETIVVGAGQAGLAVGYHLKQQDRSFVILDAHQRIGDAWRLRWDSLRLFTPARYDGLPGMRFPASPHTFPSKDEMADYLASYAARFALPVRTGVRVDRLTHESGRFLLRAGEQRFEADNVVISMSLYQDPRVPAFARELRPGITQLHAIEYGNPRQLQAGGVLVVGAGNSGCEIALEAARANHPTWLAGRDTGHLPFHIEGLAARLVLLPLILGFAFHRVLTLDTPMGRRKLAQMAEGHGMPLIRIKPKELKAAGIERVPRMAGARDGMPLLEDGRILDVTNVVWSTGFEPGWSWIDLPVFGATGPRQKRGVVAEMPGLYFTGLPFIYAVSSAMVQGVGRDAEYVAKHIANRESSRRGAMRPAPQPRESLSAIERVLTLGLGITGLG